MQLLVDADEAGELCCCDVRWQHHVLGLAAIGMHTWQQHRRAG